MRIRYGLAALFVGVVGGLILVRDAGYLGGRTDGGPLRLGLRGNGASASARPGQGAGIGGGIVLSGGEGVRVASAQPDFLSPGVRFRGPRVDAGGRCGSCPFPGRGRRVIGRTVTAADRVAVFGLQARRPGVYFALGLTVDYRRGSRRFRYRDDQTLCLSVGPRKRCTLDYALPDGAEVAEAGGPSAFGAPIRESDDPARPLRVVYPAVSAQRSPAFTLTNLTGRGVSVRDVAIARVQAGRFSVRPGAAEPAEIELEAHGSRRVRLSVTVTGCLPEGEAVGPGVSATVGGERTELPMSVGFEFRGRGCPH